MRTVRLKRPASRGAPRTRTAYKTGRVDVEKTASHSFPLIQTSLDSSHCTCGGGCPRCVSVQDSDSGIHRKGISAVSPIGSDVDPLRASKIASLQGLGRPLSRSVRDFFEPRFGYDFSQVRVHTSTKAAQTAQELKAKAYTFRNHVVVQPAYYSPHTIIGRRLLAHELTHVLQQNNEANARQRRTSTSFTRLPEPVIQLAPKGGWDEKSARRACKGQIAKWRAAKYNFAANLLQYFLSKRGLKDYSHTSADLAEIKKYAALKICDRIGDVVNQKVYRCPYNNCYLVFKHGPGVVNVIIFHPGKGSSKPSNIRWWYVFSNKNMLYAYGGADLNVKGQATIKEKTTWYIFKKRTWKGTFDVALGDKYTYDSTSSAKTWLSSVFSNAYEAALWLERSRHGYKSFYHNAKFNLTCSR